MATLLTRPDKRNGGLRAWAVTSATEHGKRSRVWVPLGRFLTLRDAEREFRRVAEQYSREKVRNLHDDRAYVRNIPTLSGYVPTYLREAEGVKLNAIRGTARYRIALTNLCRFLGDILLHELTPAKVDGFVAARRKESSPRGPISPKTVINELVQLSSLCGWAVREGVIKEHPFRNPQRPLRSFFPKDTKKPKTYLTFEEQTRLLETAEASPYAHTVVSLLLHLGVRRGELIALRVDDVDLSRRQITVRADKTDDYRILPIHSNLVPILQKLKAHRPTRGGWHPRDERHREYLLCDDKGKRLDQMGKSFLRRLAFRAGLAKNLTPHVFRHTFVSNLRAAGFSSYEIQALTGHRNVSTLEGYGVNVPQGLSQKIEGAFQTRVPQLPPTLRKVDDWVDDPGKATRGIKKPQEHCVPGAHYGAGDGTRTHDVQLGKLAFYH